MLTIIPWGEFRLTIQGLGLGHGIEPLAPSGEDGPGPGVVVLGLEPKAEGESGEDGAGFTGHGITLVGLEARRASLALKKAARAGRAGSRLAHWDL